MDSNISLASPQRPDAPSAFWPVPHPLVASRVAPKARPRATHLLRSSSERVAGAEPTPTGWRSTTELSWLPTGVAPLGPVPLIDPAPQGSSWTHRSTHALEDGVGGPVLIAPIDIRVLGSLRVFGIRGQCQGSVMGRHQLRNLLAMLAASASPLPAERIMDLLWPKSDVPHARNRLHHCLNMLRGGLSELAWDDNWIRVEKGMLLLDARIRTDAGLLEDAVAQGLNLYSDDELLGLTDLCTGHCTAEVGDDESMRSAKDRLDLLQTLVLRAAVTRLDAGKHMMLMRELLQRLLRLQPLDEWALERLADQELRAQQRRRALRTLQEAEDLMKHRLNVPAPKKLQAQLLRIDALTASDRLHGATPPERLMLGRDELIAPMLDQIDVGPTLWNIHGAPGVGKQALLNCLTERLDHRFHILRLDLSGPLLADLPALPQITHAPTADDRPLVLMVYAQDLPMVAAKPTRLTCKPCAPSCSAHAPCKSMASSTWHWRHWRFHHAGQMPHACACRTRSTSCSPSVPAWTWARGKTRHGPGWPTSCGNSTASPRHWMWPRAVCAT
jgi:DNA-binding SARP family transcriptional activator